MRFLEESILSHDNWASDTDSGDCEYLPECSDVEEEYDDAWFDNEEQDAPGSPDSIECFDNLTVNSQV